jgi:hypothetical protein
VKSSWFRVIFAGLAGGFVGNGVLGALFSSPPVHRVLYNPAIQSALFIDITPTRNIPVSVAGLVVLSIVHAWLFAVLRSSIPGTTWFRKGLFWGFVIWSMYWLFQEWFIYHTLLGEPLLLNLLELTILLAGSLIEGVIIARIVGASVDVTHRPMLSNRDDG